MPYLDIINACACNEYQALYQGRGYVLMYMLCANCGSGQSIDCAAQSMDPSFAPAIQGLYDSCAIHGLRNLMLTGSQVQFLVMEPCC